jgi:hypothetical protein
MFCIQMLLQGSFKRHLFIRPLFVCFTIVHTKSLGTAVSLEKLFDIEVTWSLLLFLDFGDLLLLP